MKAAFLFVLFVAIAGFLANEIGTFVNHVISQLAVAL
jgi:hypothetical protein